MRLLLLELNEINFDHVRRYVDLGKLPQFARLLKSQGLIETTSEKSYDELEPWIQWVTAHTGKSLAEHGVFRLGDIMLHDIPQIWERLEEQGLSVGAVSPMNAKNRCRNPVFFIPDPWTSTTVTGTMLLRKLHGAVVQAVNDNARSRVTFSSAVWLVAGILAYARPVNYRRYFGLTASALRRRPWTKALALDQLLADVFIRQVRRRRPDFASLFLNAGAHVQHHYMFNSRAYSGPLQNPSWYVAEEVDPVLEVYELYDRIVEQIAHSFPGTRLMIATGLHQDPHSEVTFYWRLRDHAGFLRRIGIKFERVEPRMSRDFVVICASQAQAADAARRLRETRSADGKPLFQVDNRGSDLFVMLTWPHDIPEGFKFRVDNGLHGSFRAEVAFVAIKNGGHNGIGYLLDTGANQTKDNERLALSDMPRRIAAACGATWP